eukprot:278995-Amphidinium_carterae.1
MGKTKHQLVSNFLLRDAACKTPCYGKKNAACVNRRCQLRTLQRDMVQDLAMLRLLHRMAEMAAILTDMPALQR